MKTIRRVLVGFIFLFLPIISSSQEWEHPYFSYTKENGLPSNLVFGSLIDKDGLLWVCTDGGVVLFDGSNSRVLTTLDGLPSNDVYHMFCDSKNRLWFTTLKNEVSYYFNGKIHNSQNDDVLAKIKTKSWFPRYFEDPNGKIWIYLKSFEVYTISNNDEVLHVKPKDPINFSYKPLLDSNGVFFLSDSSTIFFPNYGENYEIISNPKEKVTFGMEKVGHRYFGVDTSHNLFEVYYKDIRNGTIRNWSGSDVLFRNRKTLTLCNKMGVIIYSGRNFDTTTHLLKTIPIQTLNYDTSNTLWISSDICGLVKSLNFKVLNSRYKFDPSSNSFNSIEKYGNKILAGAKGGRLYVINRQNLSQVQQEVLNVNSFVNYRILKILVLQDTSIVVMDNGLGIINNSDLHARLQPTRLSGLKNVYYDSGQIILLDFKGVLIGEKLREHELRLLYNNKRAYSYCRYRGRRMVGTQDSLMVIDKTYHPFPLLNPFTARIMDLQSDDSLLYAVTAENGLYIIRDYQVIHNINTTSGLSSNNCYKVRLYKDNIYVATDNGISVINRRDFSVEHIYESDGLPSGTVNDILIDKDTLYAATEAGLSMIPLQEINLDKHYCLLAKPVAVASDTTWEIPFKVVGRSTDKLSMVFHALTYIKNTKKTYYYRLAGLDTSFSLTLDKVFSFQIKRPGKYMFEAYSLNAENSPSYLLRFPITIAPLFYETVWFRAALIMLLGALTYFFYEWFDSRIRGKKTMNSFRDNRVLNLEFTAWKSSVNPHFLFNSLNTMQSFYQGEDVEKASTYLNSFSGMLRKTVNLSDRLFVGVDEEVEYLNSYLEFEKVKSKNTFDFNIEYISSEVGMLHIPTLVVQPVIENSIKHAFTTGKRGFIKVIFTKEEDKLICTICDNGPGLSDSLINYSKSKGIQLIRTKLEICEAVIKENITFTFSNKFSETGRDIIGFETVFIFPVLLKHYDQNNPHR